MRSATVPIRLKDRFRVCVSASSPQELEAPADGLSAAKGAMIGLALSAGFWAVVVAFVVR